VALRSLLTQLLLAWSLGLGLIQGGLQPAFAPRPEMMSACSAGCDDSRPPARDNCLAVCLAWCTTPGFNALNEAEPIALGSIEGGRLLRWEDFQGQTRTARPLLPPPKV
jgi:hypothetical protein